MKNENLLKNNKKFNLFKIIIINIFLLIVVVLILNFCVYKIEVKKFTKDFEKCKKGFPALETYVPIYIFKISTFQSQYENNKIKFRPPEGLEYNKPSILLFGCSYTYGVFLSDEQTLSYKLSKYCHRPVYNRANPGWGIQHMLYQLRREDFIDCIKTKTCPDYIIFVFISDHVWNRLYTPLFEVLDNTLYLRYKNKNNSLVEIKHRFIWLHKLYIIKAFHKAIIEYKMRFDSYDSNFDFMKLHFKESKKIANKKFPNAKFVILKYPYGTNDLILESPRWQELENEGFIILDANSLTGKNLSEDKYRFAPDDHPNEKAWDLIVPALAKKLNL